MKVGCWSLDIAPRAGQRQHLDSQDSQARFDADRERAHGNDEHKSYPQNSRGHCIMSYDVHARLVIVVRRITA